MMAEPIWLDPLVVDAIHFDLIRTHGGHPGIRDDDVLAATLARPRRRWADGKATDLAAIAAAYGRGFMRDRPYRDGNARVAYVAMAVFVELNGFVLDAEEAEVVTLMAAPRSRGELARWVRGRLADRDGGGADGGGEIVPVG
jgi:death-on-curing protein